MTRQRKILYGVVGEGNGHAMRSGVLLRHLAAQGHEVHVMASAKAHAYLSKRFANVHNIRGLHMIYEENRVRMGATLWSNFKAGVGAVPANIRAYEELIDQFQPDSVITDFDYWAYAYGVNHRLPILSIDNMQIISRCKLPSKVTKGHKMAYKTTKLFIMAKLPGCKDYFITTFFQPHVSSPNTTLFPPILRDEILNAQRRDGEHLLVYTTGDGNRSFVDVLRASGLECRLYGLRKDLQADERDGNLLFRPFSEATFIDDLASCRGVIAGGGFTLMGEAVYLGKPMLSVPMKGQFEQVLNARYLQLLGYGRCAKSINEPGVIEAFLAGLPEYAAALTKHKQDGNVRILQAVDDWLERA